MAKFVVCFLLVGLAASASVSPVQKVVELLDELKAKSQGDLDAEGTAQAEYAEWCDSEISDKGYSIKTAEREIGDHKAAMEAAAATIAAKESEVSELGTAISSAEKELIDAESVYNAEKATFDKTEKELTDTIDDLAGGIVQVKKGASLMQVKRNLKPAMTVLKQIIEAAGIETAKKHKLQAFLQSSEDDDLTLRAPQGSVDIGGGGHSGGILSTLEDMKTKAEDQLSTARKGNMKNMHNYDMIKMSVAQEIANKKATMRQATALKASTAEAQGKAKGELAEVETSKAADEDSVAQTKMECETKASEWAQRQEDAAAEFAAIAKAKEILVNGVKGFIQLSSTSRIVDEEDTKAARREKLVKTLKAVAQKYHSFAFTQLAHMASADPFAKIKGMITEMVDKLLAEANEEATHKAFCDEETSKSQKSREVKSMKLDKYIARSDSASSTISELGLAIKSLEGEIAEMDKSLSEAKQLRAGENSEYLSASKDFRDSAEAVAGAIHVLKSYYEGGSFIQVSSKTALASSQKSHTKDASTIISVLEMAEGDFTKLLAEAETDEEAAATAYAKLVDANKVTKATKQAEIKGKESEIKSLTAQLANYKEDKASVGEELDVVVAYLAKLKPECEVKAMSHEEKVARREAEIEGLKEGLRILEGEDIPVLMQSSLRGIRRA